MKTARDNPMPPSNPAPKPRWRWLRFFYQFSLRTMLVAVTLAAVACWWFLRPPVNVEELAGRYLELRRQVRVVGPASDSLTTEEALSGYQTDVRTITSIGWWQLLDENDDLLVNGRYDNDLPHGKWTLWHANGRKAAEGEAFRGGRTGLWRVWDEQGTLRSEVTYRAVAPQHAVTTSAAIGGIGVGPSGVMLIAPLGQLPPPYTPSPPMTQSLVRYISHRHGPCRVWYASGQLRFEGQYADDQRDGVWTFYDEHGGTTESGPYKAGLRDGEWRITGTKPGPGGSELAPGGNAPGSSLLPAKITYVAGRTQAEQESLLARLAADLAGDSVRRQVAAAARLEELGEAGVPILKAALTGERPEANMLVLRSLMRLESLTADLLPKIEPLTNDDDSRLALRAMLAVHQLAPERRGKLYPRIMALAGESANRDLALEALVQVCNLDADRRLLAFMSLIERLAHDVSTTGPRDPFLAPLSSTEIQPVQQLKTNPVPLLAAAFGHRDPQVRVYVLMALEQIVESGEAQRPLVGGAGAHWTWTVPPGIQAVLERAKNDSDPEVRMQAEQVGREPVSSRGGGFF
jgi:hypothetical protein